MLKIIKDTSVEALVDKLNSVEAYTISLMQVSGVWIAVYKDKSKDESSDSASSSRVSIKPKRK